MLDKDFFVVLELSKEIPPSEIKNDKTKHEKYTKQGDKFCNVLLNTFESCVLAFLGAEKFWENISNFCILEILP